MVTFPFLRVRLTLGSLAPSGKVKGMGGRYGHHKIYILRREIMKLTVFLCSTGSAIVCVLYIKKFFRGYLLRCFLDLDQHLRGEGSSKGPSKKASHFIKTRPNFLYCSDKRTFY